jgi:hypothetical protein
MHVTRRTLLALPLAAACSAAGERAAVLHVTPDGAGAGASWDDAAPLTQLNALLERLAPGGEVLIAADRGVYQLEGAIELAAGGRADARLRVRGVNSQTGAAEAAQLQGLRGGDEEGDGGFVLLRRASHLEFSHIAFDGFGNGCVRVAAPIADLVVEDCTYVNVYRFFENTAARTERHATLQGFAIRRCSGAGAERGFARIRYASSDGVLEDCIGEGLANEGGSLPAGIALDGEAHDITLRRCIMRNFQQWRAGNYWNGDGFSDEAGNHGIVYQACEAYGSTDGGFDCKSREVALTDCIAGDNKRNYRIWSGRATLTRCTSNDPNFRGAEIENTSACHIWIGHEEGDVRINDLTVVDSGEVHEILEFEHDRGRVEIHGVTIIADREEWGDDAERVLASMIVSR